MFSILLSLITHKRLAMQTVPYRETKHAAYGLPFRAADYHALARIPSDADSDSLTSGYANHFSSVVLVKYPTCPGRFVQSSLFTKYSLGDCSIENLCSEEATLGFLDNLLVDVVRGVVHDNCAVLAVNLGVQSSFANEIDNPLLAIIRIQAKLLAQIANIHSAEDLAVAFAD